METIEEYKGRTPKWKGVKKNFSVNPANYEYLQKFNEDNDINSQALALDYIFNTFQWVYKKGKNALGEVLAKLDEALKAKTEAEEKADKLETRIAQRDTEIEKLESEIEKLSNKTGDESEELKSVKAELSELQQQKENTSKTVEESGKRFMSKYPHLNSLDVEINNVEDIINVMDQIIEPYKTAAENATKVAKDAMVGRPDYRKLKDELETGLPKLFPGKLTVTDRVPVTDELFTAMLIAHAITDKSSIFPDEELAREAVKPYIKK